MKNQIALFLPSLSGGGAERVMVNLARGFATRRLKVDVVLAKAKGPYLSEVPKEVRVVDLGASRVLTSLPALVKYLRSERPTAMLSAMNYANVVALWAKRLAKVPLRIVVSEHDTLSVSTGNAKNARSYLIPFLMTKSYPSADAVVAVSQGVRDDLVRATGIAREKVQVIYNPVVTTELFTKAEEHLDDSWFAPGNPPVIMGVGRLTAQKDFSTLIRAFASLQTQRAARLMILGEGEERFQLEALVQELGLQADVALPGFIANPYKYLKWSTVFVLSSRWEGLGNVLIEAMAMGTSVVSTDCPNGPAEILESGRWGRLVPVGDVDALTKAMIATLDDPAPPDVARRAMDFEVDAAVDAYARALRIS